jgi:hypothetical protein
MSNRRKMLVSALAVLALHATPARAALDAVSGTSGPVPRGGPRQDVAYSLATGYPLWYQDSNGLRLSLCLDNHVEIAPGSFINPCLTAEPFLGAPISFPANFGSEAFYWAATGFAPFTSARDGVPVPGSILLVLSLEAGFSELLQVDGAQAVFARIRVRVDTPVAGRYRVTHPYGTREYTVTTVTADREIRQTQDVGNVLPPLPAGPPPQGDFTLALEDGPAPPPLIADPGVDVGVISDGPTGIGPFLVPLTPPVIALDGSVYLSNPGTDFEPLTVPVAGGSHGNVFRVELLDPPPGFFLDGARASQVLEIDRFQVVGKLFPDRPNLRPVAQPDSASTRMDVPVTIDVVANDTDPIGPANAHGIDVQAIGLPSLDAADPPGTILLTRPLTTARGGQVRRLGDLPTGRSTFLYTPPAGFTGEDTFQYVVQDRGGLVSAPATVTVTVEDVRLERAEYRARTGRWRIEGTSTNRAGNAVTIVGSPRAHLVPPGGGAAGTPEGRITLRLGPEAADFRVIVDPLPPDAVTEVHLHAGAPGGGGPVVLSLFHHVLDGAFTGARGGTVTVAQLFPSRAEGIETFGDAMAAILAGRTYVDVHTAAGPALAGGVVVPVVGIAPVDPATGRWSFTGKSAASPGAAPLSVNAISARGVSALGAPLRLR